MTRQLYHPVLDCFMRALPYAYRNIDAQPGTFLQFDISGECGGRWRLLREANAWRLTPAATGKAAAVTSIPQAIAWRVFTKGINRAAATAQTEVAGNGELGRHILSMTAVVG
jgi:hypothetical protein